MASDPTLQQDEIEALLKQAEALGTPSAGAPTTGTPAGGSSAPSARNVESLLNQAKPAAQAGGRADDGSKPLSQNDIEALFAKNGTTPPPTAANKSSGSASPAEPSIQPDDIELLLQQAEAAIRSIDDPNPNVPGNARAFRLEEFAGALPNQEVATIQLLRDVELDLKIELGRTHMYLEEVLKLRKGSVVPLDKLAGDPVDIYVNGRLIARGEVLVLNENFCVRVAELITAESAEAG